MYFYMTTRILKSGYILLILYETLAFNVTSYDKQILAFNFPLLSFKNVWKSYKIWFIIIKGSSSLLL